MHHSLEAGQVIRTAHGIRHFQHSGEHHWHELTMRDAVTLDRVEAALGVKFVHHHGGDTRALDRHHHTDGAVW
jgi:hypothetical protein